MTHFIQTLISGLSLGSIYALIALGYTMVYGIAKMLNFAHGDIIMIGAYTGIITVAQMGLPPLIAVLISILVCALLGVLIEFLAYKPLRQAPPLSVLITAIGVSYFLQNLALILFGSQQKAYPSLVHLGDITIGSVTINGITILTLLVTAIIMVVLSFFINRTRLGKAMRAVSEDKAAATLMGISVNRTIALTFVAALYDLLRTLRLALYLHQAHHRRHARHQGIYRRGIRRHRLGARRHAGRYPARSHRAAFQDLYFHPLGRCHRLWCSGRSTGGQAHRAFGQNNE